LDTGGFWHIFGIVTRFTIFSGLVVPKKEVFWVLSLIFANCLLSDFIFQKELFFATTFGILFSKRFGLKARGLYDTWHRLLIFRKYSKDKKERFKASLTLSLIL
jgi:hypothetical protein